MAATRSVDHPVRLSVSALCVGSAASAAPCVGRDDSALAPSGLGAGAGGGRGCPFDGNRMAHAKAGPIAGRGSDRRFAEASHKRPSASANGFHGVLRFTTAREGGSSFGAVQNRTVGPPGGAEMAPYRRNYGYPHGQKWRRRI
jgi:hypothetical protein